ncbi:hypothetical protein PTH_2702 [Pelotomaculum thermopropionicum SI]|uniref:site-specific DNA-methyltransferase (adenine-specific) n=1 Tax=Pelotomaculum thermopropionicum (strain DSM 13744 / JCM 10971 / SI) TaxID=370438 RepID=A5CYP9_PELTS|nr:hypothetical protein PTH_2702 [Pelotomaculum thermopropionicum SI]
MRAVARENPKLQGIFEQVDFNARAAGQPIIDNDRLYNLIQILSRHRLGLKDVEADILGRAYEYLLRKFAEGQGQSAGEFYTPSEVAWLMALILRPRPGDEIYDPACGSGGLLIKSVLACRDAYGTDSQTAPVKIYGQEINYTTFAMAKMNAFIHDLEAEIRLGDTMARPAFTNPDGSLRVFDKVTANPMWNRDTINPFNHPEEIFDLWKQKKESATSGCCPWTTGGPTCSRFPTNSPTPTVPIPSGPTLSF